MAAKLTSLNLKRLKTLFLQFGLFQRLTAPKPSFQHNLPPFQQENHPQNYSLFHSTIQRPITTGVKPIKARVKPITTGVKCRISKKPDKNSAKNRTPFADCN
jgi:hypothetical protein